MQKKFYIPLLVVYVNTVLCSCSVHKHLDDNICGIYEHVFFDGFHRIYLASDKSFIFSFREGLLNDTVKGEYSLSENNKYIILTPEFTTNHIETICDSCSGGLYLNCCAVEDSSSLMVRYGIYDCGSLVKKTDLQPEQVHVDIPEIDSICVFFIEGWSSSYTIIPTQMQNIRIDIYASRYRTMTEPEKWKVKRNKLIILPYGIVLKKKE